MGGQVVQERQDYIYQTNQYLQLYDIRNQPRPHLAGTTVGFEPSKKQEDPKRSRRFKILIFTIYVLCIRPVFKVTSYNADKVDIINQSSHVNNKVQNVLVVFVLVLVVLLVVVVVVLDVYLGNTRNKYLWPLTES